MNKIFKYLLLTSMTMGAQYFLSFVGTAFGLWYGAEIMIGDISSTQKYTAGDTLSIVLLMFLSGDNLGTLAPCIKKFS
jgi:hypothetical protein